MKISISIKINNPNLVFGIIAYLVKTLDLYDRVTGLDAR
jgi:hypothetical protein